MIKKHCQLLNTYSTSVLAQSKRLQVSTNICIFSSFIIEKKLGISNQLFFWGQNFSFLLFGKKVHEKNTLN
jgi:hypothetical protein